MASSSAARDAPTHGRAEPEMHAFADDGVFPNSRLPVLIYRGVLATPEAAAFERMFDGNGWSPAWRNGLFSVHHYHSTAHEVLGIYGGRVNARLGGPKGKLVTLVAGDVVVIPAGMAHKNDGASADFRVVGAYPAGTAPDMQYGKPGERPGTDRDIARVGLPAADPVRGAAGVVWRKTT
ncbi:MAG TPA: hypothetical protein VIF57_28185 [Polyangia bacterium]|jgi:uncharacterized protein YjlB